MWKGIRCEKENQDTEEMCPGCGNAKSMDYINYRTLSRINNSVIENWKAEQNTSEFFAKQGIAYLEKAAELFEKVGLSEDSLKTKEVMKAVKDKITADGETSVVWKTALLRFLNVCSAVNKKRIPVLMADNNMDYVLGSNTFRDKIREIEFVKIDLDLVPRSAWDVSDDKKGSVWAWLENTDSGKILKIGSENGIYANPDCEGLFQNYMNVTRIEFHDLFNTSQVTSMKGMFSNCFELKELDVSEFDTGNVTDMSKMFFYCRALRMLDAGSFDTRNVTSMMHMFAWCENLTELNTSSFDTSRVNYMLGMFSGCKNLTKLDVSGFRIRYDTAINYMFSDCENLTELNMRHFDSRKIAETPNMFEGCRKLRL